MDINCIRSANLTKAILVMDTPQLFHQALSCGHPLFADWVPEKVTEYRNRYYQYDPVYKKIRRLCALSEEDDVAQGVSTDHYALHQLILMTSQTSQN